MLMSAKRSKIIFQFVLSNNLNNLKSTAFRIKEISR